MCSPELIDKIKEKMSKGEITEEELMKSIVEVKEESLNLQICMDHYQSKLVNSLCLESSEVFNKESFNDAGIELIKCNRISIDRFLEKQERHLGLSDNSRELIKDILLASPEDFRQGHYGMYLFSPKTRKITKETIRNFLHSKRRISHKEIDYMFDELKKFTTSLN